MLPRDLVVVHRLDSIYERYDLSLSWLGMVCRFEVRFASSFVSVVIDMYIYIWIIGIGYMRLNLFTFICVIVTYRLKVKCYWLRNVYYDFI